MFLENLHFWIAFKLDGQNNQNTLLSINMPNTICHNVFFKTPRQYILNNYNWEIREMFRIFTKGLVL